MSKGGVALGSGAQMDPQSRQVSGAVNIASGAAVNALSGASVLLTPGGKAIAKLPYAAQLRACLSGSRQLVRGQ